MIRNYTFPPSVSLVVLTDHWFAWKDSIHLYNADDMICRLNISASGKETRIEVQTPEFEALYYYYITQIANIPDFSYS